jgi:hypothetical protein
VSVTSPSPTPLAYTPQSPPIRRSCASVGRHSTTTGRRDRHGRFAQTRPARQPCRSCKRPMSDLVPGCSGSWHNRREARRQEPAQWVSIVSSSSPPDRIGARPHPDQSRSASRLITAPQVHVIQTRSPSTPPSSSPQYSCSWQKAQSASKSAMTSTFIRTSSPASSR